METGKARQGKAPRIALTAFLRQRKSSTHLPTKTGKKQTTAGASDRQTPPEAELRCRRRHPPRLENNADFLTIKTLAALSSCVITSGAPTAAIIIVPLQWRAMRSALWDYSAGTRRRVEPGVNSQRARGLRKPERCVQRRSEMWPFRHYELVSATTQLTQEFIVILTLFVLSRHMKQMN